MVIQEEGRLALLEKEKKTAEIDFLMRSTIV